MKLHFEPNLDFQLQTIEKLLRVPSVVLSGEHGRIKPWSVNGTVCFPSGKIQRIVSRKDMERCGANSVVVILAVGLTLVIGLLALPFVYSAATTVGIQN